jgi:hypothetical protein
VFQNFDPVDRQDDIVQVNESFLRHPGEISVDRGMVVFPNNLSAA